MYETVLRLRCYLDVRERYQFSMLRTQQHDFPLSPGMPSRNPFFVVDFQDVEMPKIKSNLVTFLGNAYINLLYVVCYTWLKLRMGRNKKLNRAETENRKPTHITSHDLPRDDRKPFTKPNPTILFSDNDIQYQKRLQHQEVLTVEIQ